MTRLRAAYNDANERVFVSAQSLHGGIEASGKKQLRVLSTPHYKTHRQEAGVVTKSDI